jgi:hypothetical protein
VVERVSFEVDWFVASLVVEEFEDAFHLFVGNVGAEDHYHDFGLAVVTMIELQEESFNIARRSISQNDNMSRIFRFSLVLRSGIRRCNTKYFDEILKPLWHDPNDDDDCENDEPAAPICVWGDITISDRGHRHHHEI